MSRKDEPEGIWQHSTEGDHDPDLTEEAEDSGWEPASRRPLGPLLGIVAVLVLIAMLAPLLFWLS